MLVKRLDPKVDEVIEILNDVLESGGTRFTLKIRQKLEKAEKILQSLSTYKH